MGSLLAAAHFDRIVVHTILSSAQLRYHYFRRDDGGFVVGNVEIN